MGFLDDAKAKVEGLIHDNPDKVEVSEVQGEQTSVIELRVSKEDLGKVIGKQGKTAKAMRTILSAASAKVHKRTVLEIIE